MNGIPLGRACCVLWADQSRGRDRRGVIHAFLHNPSCIFLHDTNNYCNAMSAGRVQCLLIATKTRYVVYERFYESFSEADKAGIREAFNETADSHPHEENHEIVGRYK